MRLKLLRSAWGLGEALTCRAPHTIEKLRAAGYHGLEASLSDMGSTPSDRRDFVRAARTGGLQLVLSAYSSWPNYEGPFDAQAKHAVHVRRCVSTRFASITSKFALVYMRRAHGGATHFQAGQRHSRNCRAACHEQWFGGAHDHRHQRAFRHRHVARGGCL